MIFCEFNLCIYNKKGRFCKLKNITLSPLGLCDECIIPNFDEKELEKYKKQTLEKLEKQFQEMENSGKNEDDLL